jgi:transcriptional regulator with XRE-family HTH domain
MNIKDLRLKKGYSQEELANLTGLSTRTIQRIEKDNKGSNDSLNAIADIYEISYEELVSYIEKENETTKQYDKKLIVFLLVNLMLFIINILTTPEHLWFIYPLLGWGVPFFYKRYKNSKNESI